MRRKNGYNRNNNEKKERIIMLGSAVFVLAALTMTGVYVKENSNKEKYDGYSVEFEKTEEGTKTEDSNIVKQTVPNQADNSLTAEKKQSTVKDDYMDYIPPNGSTLESASQQGNKTIAPKQEDAIVKEEEPEFAQAAEFASLEEEESIATAGDGVENVAQPALTFSDEDHLSWPIVGNILINYSMDKTTFFPTLDQYKYNPAIVIAATADANITAAANGKVIQVYENEEIGTAVVMDLGNGYQLTYGQLKDLKVSQGSYVNTGDIIGTVAAPTKYYSVEGCNVYFKLTKDGVPVDPMGKLN